MKLFLTTVLALALMPSVWGQGASKTTTEQQAKVEQQVKRDNTGPDSYYKLNFTVSEVEDAKRVNQREYSMIVRSSDSRQNTVKATTRVPIATAESQSHDKQITYIDVGLQISCSMLKELTDKIAVTCDVEISNILTDQTTEARNSLGPVLRTTSSRYVWAVLVPGGKPSLFTTIDDVNSKKRIQVEATATKID